MNLRRCWQSDPTKAGSLLEIIWIELDAGREVVIHAMGLRSTFRGLLDDWEQRE